MSDEFEIDGQTFVPRLARDYKPRPDERPTVLTTPPPDGALPIGASVVKTRSEPGDATADGTHGVVIGHLAPETIGAQFVKPDDINYGRDEFGYWVKWDTFPLPVLCRSRKVAAA